MHGNIPQEKGHENIKVTINQSDGICDSLNTQNNLISTTKRKQQQSEGSYTGKIKHNLEQQ